MGTFITSTIIHCRSRNKLFIWCCFFHLMNNTWFGSHNKFGGFAALQRTASNSVRIANERNELRKQVTSLTREVEDIKQQNRELENKTAQNWFLIGGGVVVGGILLGLILPHLRVRRRKSSWGSL